MPNFTEHWYKTKSSHEINLSPQLMLLSKKIHHTSSSLKTHVLLMHKTGKGTTSAQ